MPQITYNDWKAGLDVRQGVHVADANRLRASQNCYITTGKVPKKRPALVDVDLILNGTHGLSGMGGKLHVVADAGAGFGSGDIGPVYVNELDSIAGAPDITRVWYAEHFNGFLYAAIEYDDGTIKHHYKDGNPTEITDANCPHSKILTKRGSRIFSASEGSGDVVRYCAGANPRTWTPEVDPSALSAGFLPVNIQADGNDRVVSLGAYNDLIVAFTDDHAQLWHVDADQSTNQFRKLVYTGARSADGYAVDGMVGDLFFLSNQGVRSITLQAQTDNVYDNDVGSPIDVLVSAELGEGRARHIRKYGQFWLWFDFDYTNEGGEMVQGTKVYVYTHSRVSKVSAWSTYIFPVRFDYVAEAYQTVYIRTGDRLCKLDDTGLIHKDFGMEGTEEGETIDVLIEMPYVDMKTPGVLKQVTAADFIFAGTAEFSIRYDARDESLPTQWQSISGDSRPGPLVPVEIMATSIAPVVRHRHNEDFRLDAMTFHYHNLGPL